MPWTLTGQAGGHQTSYRNTEYGAVYREFTRYGSVCSYLPACLCLADAVCRLAVGSAGASLVELPDGAHYPPIENPTRFVAAIESFVEISL